MVDFDEALTLVLSTVERLPFANEALADALGCVLASDIVCLEDIPPFRRSTMDGYAVRSWDFHGGAPELRVVEEIPAGRVPRRTLEVGQASRIFTGGMMPKGADAVIIQEEAEPLGSGCVRFSSLPTPGQFVLGAGDIARTGDVLIEQGEVLAPPGIALLASVGITAVPAYPRPHAYVMSTGDELVEPEVRPGPAQVRNSNAPMLVGALQAAGVRVDYLGIATDDRGSLRPMLEKGLGGDILLVSGGVSVGTHDLVGKELEGAGVEPVFTRVAVKPGKPIFFGRRGPCIVFGLPGNTASSLVGFELFVRPALCKMRGLGDWPPKFLRGALATSVEMKRDRLTFLPAVSINERSGMVVRPLEWAGSADIRALVHANCLVAIPPGESPVPGGAEVDFVTFQWVGYCA